MKRALLLVFLGMSLILPACGDDAVLPPGNLRINWRVGTSGCALSGVETIAAYLTGGGRAASEVFLFDCEDEGGTITGLEPGTYDLMLRGRDENGIDRFGGEVPNIEVRSAGTTNVPTVRLSALTATLVVSWYFENGRMCAYNGVETIDIALFEDEYEIDSTTAPCIEGLVEMTEIQADTYILDLIARDAEGVALFSGQEEVVLDRGDRESVEVQLSDASPRTTVASD